MEKAGEDPKLRSHVEEALLRIRSPGSADKTIEKKKSSEKAKAQVVVPPIVYIEDMFQLPEEYPHCETARSYRV